MRRYRKYDLPAVAVLVVAAAACSSSDSPAPSSGNSGSGASLGSSTSGSTSGSDSTSGGASGSTSGSTSGSASSVGSSDAGSSDAGSSGTGSSGTGTSGAATSTTDGGTDAPPPPDTLGPDAGAVAFDSGATTRVIVAADGSGKFTTVQAAFDSIPAGNTSPIEIDVRPGTYNEKPLLAAGKGFVTLVGTDPDPTKTVITHGDSMANGINTFMTQTVQILADDFSAVNITFENSYVPVASGQNQALALSISGHRQQFKNCRFISYQDTIYVGGGTQYFKSCFVQGSVDYIFGESTAVFDGCTMYNVKSGSAVAAPSTLQTVPYGIVFLGGQLTAAPGVQKVALARPWRSSYAAVAFLNVTLGAHVSPAGWTTMAAMAPNLSLVRFFEYKSLGAGANPTARMASQLTDAQAATYTLPTLFGGWIPGLSR